MKSIIKWLLILIVFASCNLNKKNEFHANYYDDAEKFVNTYQYKKAVISYKQYLKTAGNKDNSKKFKSYINIYNCYCLIDNKKQAEKTASIVDSLAKLKDYKKYKREYSVYLVYKYRETYNYRKAIQSILNALKYFPEKDTNRAFFYYRLGVCYGYIEITDSSEFYFKKALETAQNKKDKYSFDFANYYNGVAFVSWKFNNDFYLAKQYYDSILLITANAQYIDSALYAYDLNNIGGFYGLYGIYKKASLYITEAFRLYNKIGYFEDDKMLVLIYEANIEGYQNNFESAHNKFDQAISYYNKVNEPERLIVSLRNKAICFNIQKKYSESLFFFQKVLQMYNKYKLPTPETDFGWLAMSFGKNDQPDSANYYFDKGFSVLKNNKRFDIVFNAEYARFLIKLNHNQEAKNIIEKEIKFMAENLGTKNNQYGYYIYWKALALEKLKLYLESLETYQKVVISAIEPDFKGSIYGLPPFQVSDIISHDNLIDALLGKANVLASMAALPENKKQQIFLLEKSFEHYEKASEVVRNHNKQVNTENDKLQFASIKSPINDDVLQTALKLYYVTGKQYWLEKSFAAADHGKAGVVSSGMHDDACKRMGGVPDSLVQKGKNLQEEISLLQSSIREEINRQKPDSARIGKWRSKLLETMNSSGKNAKEMEEKYPHYYQLKYAGQKLNMNLLRGQTGFRKAMVEYVFTTDSLYTFVISDKTIHLTSRPKCGIEDSVMLFRKKLSYVDDFALKQIGIKNFVYQASWLYITLIKPIEPYIKGKELIIIPDGTLSLLPFEALVTSDSIPKQPDYGLLPYMLYKYTISYAYCAELFSMQQQMKPIVAEGLLAYAPEYKSFLYNRPENLSKTSTTIMLSPLRGSQEEIKNIAQTFGGKAISGKKATETIFKKHTSENKILHLAMHTIIDNEFPMYSKLVFSKSKDTTDDGFLNTYEVYNLNLKTPLIVLSACNTGYGKLMKGEGIISLARGFIYAGCPSMVITLWSIADRSSSNLMQLFYRNLDQKQNIDKSLQNAKIEYIKSSDQRLSHPYYWAGFIESGKTTPIVKMKISHWQKWLFIIPFGILIIAGVSIYMKKDKH